MNREESIQLLKAALAGKPLRELLPKVVVCFMETEAGKYVASVDGRFKNVQGTEAEAFTQKIRLNNPLKIVEVSVMTREEYLIKNEKLENEY